MSCNALYKDVITICINCVCPYNSMYRYGKCSVAYQKNKKPGHLVNFNLGRLVGPETYNLLCVAYDCRAFLDRIIWGSTVHMRLKFYIVYLATKMFNFTWVGNVHRNIYKTEICSSTSLYVTGFVKVYILLNMYQQI